MKSSSQQQNSETFSTVEYISYLKTLHQEGPHLGNQYLEDAALQHYIRQFVPESVIKYVENQENGLIQLGDAVAGEIQQAAHDGEDNPPYLKSHDAFGKRINHLVIANGWFKQREYSAKYHIVGSAYSTDPQLQGYNRFFQNIRNYMYQPSSGLYGCPLAMTDGCAYVIQSLLKDKNFDLGPKRRAKVQKVFDGLTSNDPKKFIISGQWMTEKRGGTDVNNTTETIAIEYKENKYRLYGYKFFCSAGDCDVSLALARIIDPKKKYGPDEIRKLPVSMFLLKLRKKDGSYNGIEYQTLKEKLGTRQLPTAEMVLNGTRATLVSPPGRGIKYIVNMLQTTRLYNASTAVGIMRRMVALCRDYSDRRSVFGSKLRDLPMHTKILNDMEITFRGNLLFSLKIAHLFGKVQNGVATKDEANIARIGSPLLKLFTAKEAQFCTSEGMEIFGGIGYCENSRIPVLFRDGQVLPIWEGTSNVMSHDFHRAISQRNNPVESLAKYIQNILTQNSGNSSKINSTERGREGLKKLETAFQQIIGDITNLLTDRQKYKSYYETFMRDIALSTSRIFTGSLLLEVYANTGLEQDLEVFLRWVNMKPLYCPDKNMNIALNQKLALNLDEAGNVQGTGDVDSRGKQRPKL